MPSNVDIESWKFSPREPTSPSIGRLKTRVMTLPEKLRNLAASIRAQEDLSMELDSLAHVAETLLTPKPSEAHQIDALTERAEVAEGLVAQYKVELKTAADDIDDWRLRHQNLSQKYSELSWMYQELSR